jgi:UDP-glucose:(heptosyl)LPS alpha-1,3-glucosyltransferase
VRITLVFQGCSRRGGVERIVWEAAKHLHSRHDVTVVAESAEDLPAGVVHLAVPAGKSRVAHNGGFRGAAEPLVRASRPEVTVSYGNQCPPADVYVINSVHRAWLRQAGPLQLAGRSLPGWTRFALPKNISGLKLERDYYRQARGKWLVPCSDRVMEDLAEIYDLGGSPHRVVHNGFSPSEFSPGRRRELRDAGRAGLGYERDDLVILMAANEWQRKGLPVLLGAVERLGDPRVAVLLVGRTSPAALIERLSPALRNRVTYLGPSDDVARQHAVADLFVMPTQYEAFSLAVIEALASGLPVITTNVPGAGDAIRSGENGLLLDDPTDTAGLASLIREGMDDERRAAWSAFAPGTVADHSWENLMSGFESLLRTVERSKVS